MTAGALVLAVAAGPAVAAEPGMLVGAEFAAGRNALSPARPTCTLLIAARFSVVDFAFASGKFDLGAADGVFSSPEVLLTTGANPGLIIGSRIEGIVVGQINMPPLFQANPANPIAVYRVAYTATNFTPRMAPLWVTTRRFDVFPSAVSSVSESRLSQAVNPEALIRVVPAPAAAALGAVGGVMRARRRR